MGIFRLWDKNFELIAEWENGQPIYVTLDYEDGHRESGLLRLAIDR